MDDREDGSDTKVASPQNPISDAALARYARRMRPMRIAYAAALAVAVVVIAAIVVVAYNRGEISHVTLKTVAAGPPSLALQAPAKTLTKSWTSTDTTALGTPYYKGTVVTHDKHTVRGRDARTGKQTWSYTRTDRSVCAALQNAGLTVAVYKLHGNCDELTAVDSATGARRWTRTLDKDGAEFNGPARFAVHSGTFFFVSASSIYAIAAGGLDFWTFHHVGCTINGAVLGDAGALISQDCANENCSGAKFCGNGKQLLLRNGVSGYDNDSKTNKNNPDQIFWNKRGNDLVPTLAGHQVAARDPAGGSLQLLNAKNGAFGVRLTLSGRSDRSAPSAVISPGDADLIWIAGRTYALPIGNRSFGWQADMPSVPTVVDSGRGTTLVQRGALLAVPTTSGFALLEPNDGNPTQSFPVGAPPAGSLVYRLGSGFLVAGPATIGYR